MSVVWLVPPLSLPCTVCAVASIPVIDLDTRDIEATARALKGVEIVVTRDALIGADLFDRCRWLRGIVGIGSRVRNIVDWDFVERRMLLAVIIDAINDGVTSERLVSTLATMERRLRAYDDIAEDWEGT